jgi:hypothetical protein
MTTFHPNTIPPVITVAWVESVHQLGQILDGYANMARVPVRLLTVKLTGAFQQLSGTTLRGEFYFNDFCFSDGEALIETRVNGFRTFVRPLERFDVEIEV